MAAVSDKTRGLMSFAHMSVSFQKIKGYKFLYLYVDIGRGSNVIRPVQTVRSRFGRYDLLELLLFFDFYLEELGAFP